MNTLHTVQIAFSFDDEAIQNQATDMCAKEVLKALSYGYLDNGYYGHKEPGSKLKDEVQKSIDKFIDDHANEIQKAAIELVAEKIMRTKAMKTAMADLINASTAKGE